jgi:predicted nucleic acid-binding protein
LSQKYEPAPDLNILHQAREKATSNFCNYGQKVWSPSREFRRISVTRKSSDLRAAQQIIAPDAIQFALAILHGATVFLTNDKIFERVKEVEVLILDKLLKP